MCISPSPVQIVNLTGEANTNDVVAIGNDFDHGVARLYAWTKIGKFCLVSQSN